MNKPLRELADVHYGKSPSEVLSEDGEFPIVGTGGVYGRARSALFSGPAVVVARKGSLGNPQHMNTPFWPVDTTYAVVPKAGIDAKWLYYNLDRYDLTKLNEATGVPSISRDWLYRITFDDPGSKQQLKIAEILSTLDEAIEQTETLIVKMQQVKTGLMHDLFTRGVTLDGHLRPTREQVPDLYKESPLGWIPKEWEVSKLSEVADVNRGKFTIRPRNDPRFYGGEYPFIQTGDVSLVNGRFLTTYSQTLNAAGLSVSRLFDEGTIMVTIAANIADTCILGVPMCAPDSLVGVLPNKGQVSRFLELCIRRRKSWLEARAPQTAQKNINLEDLRPLLIPTPSKNEQETIESIYESMDLSLVISEQEIEKLRQQKHGLMKDLLTGRVRVNAPKQESVKS